MTIVALAVLLLWSGLGEAQSDSTEIPKHLVLARELVQNIKPETKWFFSYDPRVPSETRLRTAAVGRPVAGDGR